MGITKIKRYMAHTTKRIVKLSLLSLEPQSSGVCHICHQFLYEIPLFFFAYSFNKSLKFVGISLQKNVVLGQSSYQNFPS